MLTVQSAETNTSFKGTVFFLIDFLDHVYCMKLNIVDFSVGDQAPFSLAPAPSKKALIPTLTLQYL